MYISVSNRNENNFSFIGVLTRVSFAGAQRQSAREHEGRGRHQIMRSFAFLKLDDRRETPCNYY